MAAINSCQKHLRKLARASSYAITDYHFYRPLRKHQNRAKRKKIPKFARPSIIGNRIRNVHRETRNIAIIHGWVPWLAVPAPAALCHTRYAVFPCRNERYGANTLIIVQRDFELSGTLSQSYSTRIFDSFNPRPSSTPWSVCLNKQLCC